MTEHRNDVGEQWRQKSQAWIRNAEIFDHAFAPFTTAVTQAADLHPGQTVLDVGCGPGTLLETITDIGAHGIGIDISADMAAAAKTRVPTATMLVGDAQTLDITDSLDGTLVDRVVSRFGVMFFQDPVSAFANIRRAVTTGGRLAFVSWRNDETEVFTSGLEPYAALVGEQLAPPERGVPGPLGLADHDHIVAVLDAAGWQQISVQAVDAPCDYTMGTGDGVTERLSVARSGIVGQELQQRIIAEHGDAALHQAHHDAEAALREQFPDGVKTIGKVWLVTAKK